MDKYDKAIAYLEGCNGSFESEVDRAWSTPFDHPAGCLFSIVAKDYYGKHDTGCLTMIRRTEDFRAETDELTEAIRTDERIPTSAMDITHESLPVFAEWQRRLDRELNRV